MDTTGIGNVFLTRHPASHVGVWSKSKLSPLYFGWPMPHGPSPRRQNR